MTLNRRSFSHFLHKNKKLERTIKVWLKRLEWFWSYLVDVFITYFLWSFHSKFLFFRKLHQNFFFYFRCMTLSINKTCKIYGQEKTKYVLTITPFIKINSYMNLYCIVHTPSVTKWSMIEQIKNWKDKWLMSTFYLNLIHQFYQR